MKFWYSIENFGAPYLEPGDTGMGKWGFTIKLDPLFVWQCTQTVADGETVKRMNQLVGDQINRYWDAPLFSHTPLTFYESSILLSNVTVPGNACGLDMEWNALSAVRRNYPNFGEYEAVELLPHNVDHRLQQDSLLAGWLIWARYITALLPEKEWF